MIKLKKRELQCPKSKVPCKKCVKTLLEVCYVYSLALTLTDPVKAVAYHIDLLKNVG